MKRIYFNNFNNNKVTILLYKVLSSYALLMDIEQNYPPKTNRWMKIFGTYTRFEDFGFVEIGDRGGVPSGEYVYVFADDIYKVVVALG